MKRIILASASPRRRELLEKIGLRVEVEPSNCKEEINPLLAPHELARSLSQKKAEAVARHHCHALIIAADTLIVFEDRILGKPRNENEARQILETLSGSSHLVITGFTIIDTSSGKTVSRSVETRVHLRRLVPVEIEAYIKTGEPLDKAGGYAIQGLGATIIDRIEGDFFNVIGLPLSALSESLKEFGINILS